MSTLWIRELISGTTGSITGMPAYLKALALFLKHVVGYTQVASVAGYSGVGNSLSKSSSTITLTDSESSFDTAVVGSTITLTGCTNGGNNGTFTITARTGVNSIQWTNASGATETSSFNWTVNGTYDWFSYEKTGSNGSFAGGTYNFVDATANSFVGGDSGKWLIIRGSNQTTGIYRATYVSASTMSVDFRSKPSEFPNSGALLSWWLVGDNYQVPKGTGSYYRVKTLHSRGWDVEFKYDYVGGQRISVRVALTGDWGGKILGPVYFGSVNDAENWCYAAVDSAGEYIFPMTFQLNNNRYNGAGIAHYIPYSNTVNFKDHEKIILLGNVNSDVSNYDSGNFKRDTSTSALGHGYSWRDYLNLAVQPYIIELSSSGYTSGFSKWTSRQKNHRFSGTSGSGDSITKDGSHAHLVDSGASFQASDVGRYIEISNCVQVANEGTFQILSRVSATEITIDNAYAVSEVSTFVWSISERQDMLYGFPVTNDADNNSTRYDIPGRIVGSYAVRGGTTDRWSSRKAFHSASKLDKFHFNDGVAFDWTPGVTPPDSEIRFYAVQQNNVKYWSSIGRTWIDMGYSGWNSMIRGIYVVSPTDIWVAGEFTNYSTKMRIAHYNGSSWSDYSVDTGPDLRWVSGAIFGFAPDNVWVAGGNSNSPDGRLVKWNGSSWSVMGTVPSYGTVGMWGTGPNDLYFTGSRYGSYNGLFKWNGSTVTMDTTQDTVDGCGIWGLSSTNMVFSQYQGCKIYSGYYGNWTVIGDYTNGSPWSNNATMLADGTILYVVTDYSGSWYQRLFSYKGGVTTLLRTLYDGVSATGCVCAAPDGSFILWSGGGAWVEIYTKATSSWTGYNMGLIRNAVFTRIH